MPLNLDGPRAAVERLILVDECAVTFDPEGAADDTWDDETGTYTPPVGDVNTLYEGNFAFSAINVTMQSEYGGQLSQQSAYQLSFPTDAPEFAPETVVTVTAVHVGGDASAVGEVFRIEEELKSTYTVTRRYRATRFTPIRR